MNIDILLASGPPQGFLFMILKVLLLYFACPLLALSFFIVSAVLSARKERKPANICALLGALFALAPLLYWLLAGGLQ